VKATVKLCKNQYPFTFKHRWDACVFLFSFYLDRPHPQAVAVQKN
jgi:hypothetical protein